MKCLRSFSEVEIVRGCRSVEAMVGVKIMIIAMLSMGRYYAKKNFSKVQLPIIYISI